MLERSGELIVEPLDEGGNAPGDLEDFVRGDGGQFLVIFPLLSVLDDDDVVVILED